MSVREAAERVRRYIDGEDPCEVYREQLKAGGFDGMESVADGMYDEDRHKLVEAYLAEHPADDDEPVTLPWLLQQPCLEGVATTDYAMMQLTRAVQVRWFGDKPHCNASIAVYANGGFAFKDPTRRQLSRLLSALEAK